MGGSVAAHASRDVAVRQAIRLGWCHVDSMAVLRGERREGAVCGETHLNRRPPGGSMSGLVRTNKRGVNSRSILLARLRRVSFVFFTTPEPLAATATIGIPTQRRAAFLQLASAYQATIRHFMPSGLCRHRLFSVASPIQDQRGRFRITSLNDVPAVRSLSYLSDCVERATRRPCPPPRPFRPARGSLQPPRELQTVLRAPRLCERTILRFRRRTTALSYLNKTGVSSRIPLARRHLS